MTDWNKFTPTGKQTGLAVSTSAVSLTVPADAKAATVQVFGAAIRFWSDGSTPTSSQGLRAGEYDTIELVGRNEVVNFEAIREGASDATLEILYYKD